MHNWTRPNGCRDQHIACQDKLSIYDVATVNRGFVSHLDVCDLASECQNAAIDIYNSLGRGWFDIAHPTADPFPPMHMAGYLTQSDVLGALGSPVNFSAISNLVGNQFGSTHDLIHGGFLDAVAYLLDNGVKVHMMYGDRDFACNWLGGEKASLAVPYSRQEEFAESPYGVFWTPDGFSGLTRQLGNYSFTRVFQAGHMVPSYQPVAAYEVFMRATFNYDVGSGTIPVHDDLRNDGEGYHRWIKNPPPEMPEPRCYVLWPSSCTPEVWAKVVAGEVTVKDYYVVEEEESDALVVPGDEAQESLDEL